MIFAGEEYGTGSSRDWAAKGTQLLGVKAVVAQSFERIHRSNLVGMGVLPLQFKDSDSMAVAETRRQRNLRPGRQKIGRRQDTLVIHRAGSTHQVALKLRIDTPIEVEYYQQGGILPFVLGQLMAA